VHGERICGLAWCKLDHADRTTANLFQMWVAPESRGRGAGAMLLRVALDWARGVGAVRVRLGVTAGESPASRLYAAHGFVAFGEVEQLRDGSPLMGQNMECLV
jgi:GNAT superfamily N-acetyltransferase